MFFTVSIRVKSFFIRFSQSVSRSVSHWDLVSQSDFIGQSDFISQSFLYLGGHPLPDTIITSTLFSLSNSKNFSSVVCLRDTILSSSFFWRHDASDMQEKLCVFAKIWSFQFGKLTGICLYKCNVFMLNNEYIMYSIRKKHNKQWIRSSFFVEALG